MNLGPNLGQVRVGSGSNHGSEPNVTTPRQTEMAKWIGATQEAEKEGLGVPVEEEAPHISKWKPVTPVLFSGQK